jgi:hypothetical protein
MKLFSTLIVSILFIYITLFHPFQIEAAKKRVRLTAPATNISYVSARLSRPTNSVIINLANLGTVSKVGYELSYTANGISQGVAGSITPNSNSDSRDLYFGTCSKGVCTPHYNIINAQLVVRIYFKNGSTFIKLYKIKI